MVKIEQLEYETYRINGKIITLDKGEVINKYDLTFEEERALKDFRKALKKVVRED